MQNKRLVFAVVYGVTLLVVSAGLAVIGPETSQTLSFVVRATVAVAAAGFGGVLAGSFHVENKMVHLSVAAAGALAFGVLAYLLTPISTRPESAGFDPTASPSPHSYAGDASFEHGSPATASAPVTAVIEDAQSSYQPYPAFDWPPPRPSARYTLPGVFFRRASVLGDVDTRLRHALAAAGYTEYGYFTVPGGFAIATRLEQINEDGTPRPAAERWKDSPPGPLRDFTLKAYLRALASGRVGYFRVIVFFVTDRPFSSSPALPTRLEALAWLNDGADRLHSEIARLAYGSSHAVTAYAYEFERHEGQDPVLRTPGRLTGDRHLETAGLLPRLRSQ